MKNSVFNKNWKEKFRNPRNAVSGLVNKLGSRAAGSKSSGLDLDFIADLSFIAYELIDISKPFKASSQFKRLDTDFGENVARHEVVETLSDEFLSELFDKYIEETDYEIDGLVLCDDHVYPREKDKNSPHYRAFKKQLASLTKVTTVQRIKWTVSKDGYIKPTLIFEPIDLGGAMTTKATAYNAKYIVENVLGPGAIIEITRSGGVIPKVVKFIKEADSGEAQMPELIYHWNETDVDIILDEKDSSRENSREDDDARRDIDVKRLHFFLTSMGTKGVGEVTMGKMYDAGITSIKDLISLEPEQIRFLGEKMPEKIVNAIQERLDFLTMPMLMAGSGVFGRGLGQTRFEALTSTIPDLLERPEVKEEDIEGMTKLFTSVEGFAGVYAQQTANRFGKFRTLLAELDVKYINEPNIEKEIIENDLKGKNVVLSGFRDAKISDLLSASGGKLQSGVNGKTDILVIKDASSESAKSKAAREKGVEIMTREEFSERYLN